MTRVLFWCDNFWPRIGGVEVLAAQHIEALTRRGYDFAIIADLHTDLQAESTFHGVPVHRLPFADAFVSRDAEMCVAVRRSVADIKRDFRADVVHVFFVNVGVLFHGMTAASHPAPTLCTVHGAFPDSVMAADTGVERVIRSAAWVTACSEATLADMRRQVPDITSHSSVIWNGLAQPEIVPGPLPFAPPRLLCIGRIATVEEKGFDVAIRAMPAILARFPAARLLIAGDGPARGALERIAADAGVAAHVDFLGWVHPDKVCALISGCTTVLVPSRVAEGFGLVALQASQMARPVVASRVGGLPEVVAHGETGLLVEPDDDVALAAAAVSLLDNPAHTAALGRAGRLRANTHFSRERYVNAYDDLLTKLVRGDAPRRNLA